MPPLVLALCGPKHVSAAFADAHHGRHDGVLAGAVGDADPHGIDVAMLEAHAGIGVRRLLERKAKATDDGTLSDRMHLVRSRAGVDEPQHVRGLNVWLDRCNSLPQQLLRSCDDWSSSL